MIKIQIKTTQAKEIVDITDKLNDELGKLGLTSDSVNIFVTHTTCALTTADLDPGTDLDMLDAFQALIPKLNYRHPHDSAHVPDHILSALIGTSLTLPIEDGQLVLGQWQRVVLIEFSGPRERQIIISTINNTKPK
ncbi:TPA: hypothetical protein DIC39_01075 [Patescibacteria group bacterium]|nr:hypothetical protein [Patescibacteria group bacterium]HCU47641.1 hypothetical protein [Patescibacteria group bacterium]